MNIERIITHNDFDGVVSAALCSAAFGCDRFVFTGPNAIARAEISITTDDAVCDLPYPLECGAWFDHNMQFSKLVANTSHHMAPPGPISTRLCANVQLRMSP